MSTKVVFGVEFSTETCACCSIQFAMPSDFMRRRRRDGKYFYCPKGHQLHYDPVDKERQLEEKLEAANRRLAESVTRANIAENQRDGLRRSQMRLRERIKNGVCPCCNRSFGNLREHMATKHPEYGNKETLVQLIDLFGLTKSDAAREIGISPASVSNYLKGATGTQVNNLVEGWIQLQLEP